MSEEEQKVGGTYIILNVLDCKVYVGQAQEFSKRDHTGQLSRGTDNKNLQEAFDNKEKNWIFVYFAVGSFSYIPKKDDPDDQSTLVNFEKFFMELFPSIKYGIYNTHTPQETLKELAKDCHSLNVLKNHDVSEEVSKKYSNSYPDLFCNFDEEKKQFVLSVIQELEEEKQFVLSVIQELEEDFKNRFGIGVVELLKADENKREKALKHYIDKKDKEPTDRILFNRELIKNTLNNVEISLLNLNNLNIDMHELFFSKAGNYKGENIVDILRWKMQDIPEDKENGFCLWSVANNAVYENVVRKLCRDRKKNDLDTYVLFYYTPSSKHAYSPTNDDVKKRYNWLSSKTANQLTDDEIRFLGFEYEEGRYKITNVKSTGDMKYALAFVIDKFFLLSENINETVLKDQYVRVNEEGYGDLKTMSFNRQTHYLRLNDNYGEDNLKELCSEDLGRKFCFMAKLAAPYIIRIEK